VQENDADIWQLTDSHVDIFNPLSKEPLPSELTSMNHAVSVIEEQKTHFYPTSAEWELDSFTNSTYHQEYHPLFEIDEFMKELAELHPDIVKLHYIGHSAEGREMLAMTFSSPSVNSTASRIPGPGKLGFVIVGAQHAREVRQIFLQP
jgi:extracellular matrix protein 14